MKENLYKILDIDKTASKDEIKKAYRGKAKIYHPDKNKGDKSAEDMFKKVSYAYEILSDDNKKARYDSGGHDALNGGGQQRHGGMDDLFREMARQQAEHREKVQSSIMVNARVTLEEVYTGAKKKFKYNRRVKCKTCDGHGGSEPSICTGCNGAGRKVKVTSTEFGHMQEIGICPDCRGQGTSFKNVCNDCNGEGYITSREEVSVDIPYSISNGMSFEHANGGHEMLNGGYGNLIIRVQVEVHPKFDRPQEFDLISKLDVPYETLMLGGKVEFVTIDGGKLSLTIKKLSKVGNKVKLNGKGLKKRNWNHVRGDQYLVLGVEIPDSITKEEEELLLKLKKLKE